MSATSVTPSIKEQDTNNNNSFPDINEENIKHPLQGSWTLWYSKATRGQASFKQFDQNMRSIYTFTTVEDFWSVFNHIVPPAKLQQGSDYHLFREGIKPEWEDPSNSKGGDWQITIIEKTNRDVKIDDLWLNTALSLIGEGFDEYSDEICGCSMNVKAGGKFRISLWIKSENDESMAKTIGSKFRKFTELPQNVDIIFVSHAEALTTKSSTRSRAEWKA